MKRSATMTLGEFREATKDMPDRTCIMVVTRMSDGNEAQAVRPYPFCTTLDNHDVYLLDVDISESIQFTDC